LDLVSLDSFFPCCRFDINSTSLLLYWIRKIPKENIENESFKCSFFTQHFDLGNGLWFFMKIWRCVWGLKGHELVWGVGRGRRLIHVIYTRALSLIIPLQTLDFDITKTIYRLRGLTFPLYLSQTYDLHRVLEVKLP
jgi:hypothetical protein